MIAIATRYEYQISITLTTWQFLNLNVVIYCAKEGCPDNGTQRLLVVVENWSNFMVSFFFPTTLIALNSIKNKDVVEKKGGFLLNI